MMASSRPGQDAALGPAFGPLPGWAMAPAGFALLAAAVAAGILTLSGSHLGYLSALVRGGARRMDPRRGLTLSGRRITVAEASVAFHATHQDAVAGLREKLARFATALRKGVDLAIE